MYNQIIQKSCEFHKITQYNIYLGIKKLGTLKPVVTII